MRIGYEADVQRITVSGLNNLYATIRIAAKLPFHIGCCAMYVTRRT